MTLQAIEKRLEAIPVACGRTTGHGESCTKGWECNGCSTNAKLVKALREAVTRLEAIKDAESPKDMYDDAVLGLTRIASLLESPL